MPAAISPPFPVPVVRHDGPLLHYGDLHGPHESPHASSHEGPCLSCAPDEEAAEAWHQIAGLGGRDLWAVDKEGGFNLADFHKLPRKRMLEQAAASGLVQSVPAWKVSWYDSELENNCFMVCATPEEAAREAGDPSEGRKVKRVRAWAAQAPLVEYWRQRHPHAELGLTETPDAAILALLDQKFPELDGVFWRDRLDPVCYSAPRVGLFQRTLPDVRPENLTRLAGPELQP